LLGEDVVDLLGATEESHHGVIQWRCCGCNCRRDPRRAVRYVRKLHKSCWAIYITLFFEFVKPYPSRNIVLPSHFTMLLKLRFYATAFSLAFYIIDATHLGRLVVYHPNQLLQLFTLANSIYTIFFVTIPLVRKPWPMLRLGVMPPCNFPPHCLWQAWREAAMASFHWSESPNIWKLVQPQESADLKVPLQQGAASETHIDVGTHHECQA
jgi:hypothetical protein